MAKAAIKNSPRRRKEKEGKKGRSLPSSGEGASFKKRIGGGDPHMKKAFPSQKRLTEGKEGEAGKKSLDDAVAKQAREWGGGGDKKIRHAKPAMSLWRKKKPSARARGKKKVSKDAQKKLNSALLVTEK